MTEWTIDEVASRFAEAARTAHRLPPVRVQGYFSLWPPIVRTAFERLAADDAKLPRFAPTPQEIDRMLEAMRWIQWLDVEQRHLVWLRAHRYRWSDIAKCQGCVIRTAQRHWQTALEIMVRRLNGP